MAKPAILVVDDDRAVLSAVVRDLRRQYGSDYRLLSADSGSSALEALQQLKQQDQAVALFLVDQRMPGMTGVEFLQQALKLFPDAKRALLTAYADTTAAIQAINDVQIDYYFMKPWDPPEERLFPVLTDLLADWQASHLPAFEGVRLVGHRWSPESHRVKDFLARNQVPYRWLDVEVDATARQLATLEAGQAALPLLLFEDGSRLENPTNLQIAEKVGLHIHAEKPFYDLIIVGAGPAGLAAAVYGASEGLRTLVIEREAPGGQAGTSSRIENYLGFPVGLSGADLTRRAVSQAIRFGAEMLTPQEAMAIDTNGPYRVVTVADGAQTSCHALLIATGVSYRKLDVPGIDKFTGAGVYYGAAITEALACKDQDVYVVGGGNSAGQGAMYLSKYARSVTMLVRGPSLSATMSHYLIGQIKSTPNITVLTDTCVMEVLGNSDLDSLVILNSATRETKTVPANALFIFIGAAPRTDWCGKQLARDDHGFILSGPRPAAKGGGCGWPLPREPLFLETSTPGIFVAGDVRHMSIKRVASAVGEGAMAVAFVHQYLATL